MSRLLVRTVVGLLASAALVTPALAADSFFASTTVQDFDNGCGNLGGGGGRSTSPIGDHFACGSGEATAVSSVGHVGVGLHVSGNSIVDATSEYFTEVTFQGGKAGDVIPIELNLAFAGAMGIGGSADTGYNVIVDIEHVDFTRSTSIDTGAAPTHGATNLFFSEGGEVDNQLSAFVGGVLTTGPVNVQVGVPVGINLHLFAGGFGNPGSLNDGFLNSLDFVQGRDLFVLPDGYTAEDPEAFIVDNRFAPPTGAPEPAEWALMLAGFGLAGAMLRRAAPAASPLSHRP